MNSALSMKALQFPVGSASIGLYVNCILGRFDIPYLNISISPPLIILLQFYLCSFLPVLLPTNGTYLSFIHVDIY